MKLAYWTGEQVIEVEITKRPNGFSVNLNNDEHTVELVRSGDGELYLLIDGHPQTVHLAMKGPLRFAAFHGKTYSFNRTSHARERTISPHLHPAEEAIRSPMPGQVRLISIEAGAVVEKGQMLLLIEAMKMEIKIVAPRGGQVRTLSVKVGQLVEREQIVAEMESL